MKYTFILILLVLNFNLSKASPYDSLSISQIGKNFKNHIEYNRLNSNKGNSFIYISSKFSSSPTTNFEVSDWLKEDPLGITPYATEIRSKLGDCNGWNFKDPSINYDGKIQHYFIVVEVDLYDQLDLPEFQNEIAEKHIEFDGISKIKDFRLQVKTELQNQLAIINSSSIFYNSSTLHSISLLIVGKKIVNNVINAEFDFIYIGKKNESYPLLVNYWNTGYQEIRLAQGFNKLIVSLNLWLKEIFASPPLGLTCTELGLQVYSQVAQTFVTNRCNNLDDLEKDALLKNSRFIDMLFYLKNKYPGSELAEDQIGDIASKWFVYVDYFFDLYKNSQTNLKFDIWIRDNYNSIFLLAPAPVPACGLIETLYAETFFILGQPLPNRLASDMVRDLCQFFTVNGSDEITMETYNPITRYKFYRDFQNVFKWLDNGTYSSSEKQAVFNELSTFPNIKNILMDYILKPSVYKSISSLIGQTITATETARLMSELVLDVSGMENGNYPAFNSNNVIPFGFTEAYINAKKPELQIGEPYNGYFGQPVYLGLDGDNLSFQLKLCQYPLQSGFGQSWILALTQPCVSAIEESDIIIKDFWSINYAVILNNPTYINSTLYCNGSPCNDIISVEPAFYTATKIEEAKHDKLVRDVSLTISIASLPFTFAEYAAAVGFMKIVHGVWLASDVNDIIFTIAEEPIKEGLKNMFGEEKGQNIFNNIQFGNTLVSVTSVADMIKIGKNEMKNVSAAKEFLTEYKAFTGSDLPNINSEVLKKCGIEVKNDLLTRDPSSLEEINSVKAEIYGVQPQLINSPEYENIRKLICLGLDKVNDANIGSNKSIIETLNSLLPSSTDMQKLLDDLNTYPGLFEKLTPLINNIREAKLIESRIKAWKYIDETFLIPAEKIVEICE